MGDWWWRDALALIVWPGLIGGALLGWLFLWLARKLTARLQGRFGPPFYQPFFDFVKLLGKETVVPVGVSEPIFYALPLVSLMSGVFALALIPVPGNPIRPFAGDLIVLLYMLEVPALCDVLAGYSSRSLYGQVSAVREAILSLGYNLPFLAGLIALAMHAQSFNLAQLAVASPHWVRWVAGAAFLLALPARLKSNPFSIVNAEQEIVSGTRTEYNGAPLALFELAHALEFVALMGLFVAVFVPAIGQPAAAWLEYIAVSIVLVGLLTVVAAVTPRLRVNQAFSFYWSWGALLAVVSLVGAALG
jgi:NADH-quinone oxidoreductase subunit H